MVEYQVYFGPLADTWYQKDFRGKRRTISANSRISSNDIYVLYSKDLARLFKGMKGLTGMVGLQDQTEFRYEYWVTDDHPTRAWTLDNASGMKYAGIKKWWEGNHRIVICPPGQRDGKRYSRLLFRAADQFDGGYPLLKKVAELADPIKRAVGNRTGRGEGIGGAAEVAVTDGVVSFLSPFIGGS
jgi:hypothetical protein